MRYGLDGRGRRTHAHIGALLGISAQGVRQIERRTLERLRRIAAPSGLGEHLVDA